MLGSFQAGDIVERTGASDLGLTQGHTYPVREVRGSGHVILFEDDGGWPILFHPAGFRLVKRRDG